uniref:CACTA en-spm transposon protein n=1 Tax=Cucumis melo TaxID=3656 RepID=A0A9I9ECL4_CUCME
MTIAPGVEKPISPHAVRFSQAIGRFFVLDFNGQAMNRFVEHQMLTTFKEFRADCTDTQKVQRPRGGSCQPTKHIGWMS